MSEFLRVLTPDLATSVIGVAAFGLIAVLQLTLFIVTRHKWAGVMGTVGAILETIGYAGRIWLHKNPTNIEAFTMQYVTTLIGASFFLRSAFYQPAKYMTVHGEVHWLVEPVLYLRGLISVEIASFVVLIVGGSTVASNSNSHWISMAGMVTQTAEILVFFVFTILVWLKVSREPESAYDPQYSSVRNRPLFKFLLPATLVTAAFLFGRGIFRSCQLGEGIASKLETDSVYFLVLDGLFVLIAAAVSTIFHPGLCLGSEPIKVPGTETLLFHGRLNRLVNAHQKSRISAGRY